MVSDEEKVKRLVEDYKQHSWNLFSSFFNELKELTDKIEANRNI